MTLSTSSSQFHALFLLSACLLSACLLLFSRVEAFPVKGRIFLAQPLVEEPIFVGEKDGCVFNGSDFPDVPARAYSARDGTVTLLDSCSQGFFRSLRAPNSTHFVRNCKSVLPKGNDGPTQTPDTYNNSLWIQGVWALEPATADQGLVIALVHNEFHGEQATANRSWCPSGSLADCWYANAVFAKSTNGGGQFELLPVPAGAAMVSPLTYVPGGGRQGYSAVTNIVDGPDGAHYAMALSLPPNARVSPGVCVWRTSNISSADGWRAWNGSAFAIASHDPYTVGMPRSGTLCTPVAPPALRFSITFSDVLKTWVATGIGQDAQGHPAFVYATSDDLVQWSDLAVLRAVTPLGSSSFPQQAYPAILDIDYAGAGTNMVHTGASPFLYYTRLNGKGRNNRDLVRQQLVVVVAEG